jgi:hypothetical protein
MGLKLQPYEAHIPYLLQFKIDMNIYGMGHLVCRAVHFRRDPPKDTPPQISPGWNHVKSPVMRMPGTRQGAPVEVCLPPYHHTISPAICASKGCRTEGWWHMFRACINSASARLYADASMVLDVVHNHSTLNVKSLVAISPSCTKQLHISSRCRAGTRPFEARWRSLDSPKHTILMAGHGSRG